MQTGKRRINIQKIFDLEGIVFWRGKYYSADIAV